MNIDIAEKRAERTHHNITPGQQNNPGMDFRAQVIPVIATAEGVIGMQIPEHEQSGNAQWPSGNGD